MNGELLILLALSSCSVKCVLSQSKANKYCNSVPTRPIFSLRRPVFHAVVGGVPTFGGEFPHMVALGFPEDQKTQWLCGGTLISSQYVLTAAHCVDSYLGPVKKVRLGARNVENPLVGFLDVAVQKIISHPNYNPPSPYFDIALLKLGENISISNNIKPACLHTSNHMPKNGLVAIGWGQTNFLGPKSHDLLKVVLQVVPRNTCNKVFKNAGKRLDKGIEDKTQICAGGAPEGGKDTCQGDSGGPIGFKKGSRHYIVGITSFGKACGFAKIPAVYTRVSAFVPWLESIVWR